jgi:DNA replication factor GINS
MYEELFTVWRYEIENNKLGRLPSNFYERVADYVQKIKEESRMLDKTGLKASLLQGEMEHVQRMTKELVWVRYKKLLTLLTESQKLPSDHLAYEELSFCKSFISFVEAYHSFAEKLLQGHISEFDIPKASEVHKRVALRFLQSIPAIIGVDMKTYGPFLAEDIGSVPIENAKILVKQGLAERIDGS